MASKKQLVPSEILAIQNLPSVDSGFVGFGAKNDGLYMKFSDGTEYKLLTLKDGNVILSGTTAPDISLGRVGDYYINNSNWTIYGPKTTTWGSPTNLKGIDGDDGNMWYTGATLPSNSTYLNGDFFLRTDGLLYQKVSGTWSYITTLRGGDGSDGIGTAESVGVLISSLTTKATPTSSDSWTLRDETTGLWRKINTTELLAFLELNFDLKYEPINSVVVNYYVTNLTELVAAWNDAQTKTIPSKIYANGVMNLTANLTLTGTREVPIEGVPSVRFDLNTFELDIYRPHLTSVLFFSPNTNGYIKARNGYATLNRVFFAQDNYTHQEEGINLPNIPHVVIVGTYTNNTGGVNINGLIHQTNLSDVNENPDTIIQPIWIKDTSGNSGQRLFVDIKGVSVGRSFDRFCKVLITADNPNLIVLVGGDTTWFYDNSQPNPGLGISELSTLKPITSIHELRLNDFEEITTVEDEDRVLIQQGNKVVLAPKTSVGGGGSGTTDYTQLTNKPRINNVELSGNKTSSELGLQPSGNYITDSDNRLTNSRPASDVYTWAKQPNKPNYTASEVGAQPTEAGKGLSESNYTAAEKTKLSGIQANAQVNVINVVKVNGTPLVITNKEVDIPAPDTSALVPYTGADKPLNLATQPIRTDKVQLTTGDAGEMTWNAQDKTVDLKLNDHVTLQLGQESLFLARNETGSTIANGVAVMYGGVTSGSGRIKIIPAIANGNYSPKYYVGLTTESISNGVNGFVTAEGYIRGFDTRGTNEGENWVEGDVLYINQTVAGRLTNIPPALGQKISVGVVITRHQTNGVVLARCLPYDSNNSTKLPKLGFQTLDATLSIVHSTRVFTITGPHTYYINDIEVVKNTTSTTLANVTGIHYVFYNSSNVLTSNTTGFEGTQVAIVVRSTVSVITDQRIPVGYRPSNYNGDFAEEFITTSGTQTITLKKSTVTAIGKTPASGTAYTPLDNTNIITIALPQPTAGFNQSVLYFETGDTLPIINQPAGLVVFGSFILASQSKFKLVYDRIHVGAGVYRPTLNFDKI
jgi:hypothetical protein